MKKNKKILQICGSWGNGGVERIIKNYISKWDINNISMDILSYKHAANSVFDSYLSEKNIKLYSIDNLPTNDFNEIIVKCKKLYELCKNNNYDIVHFNAGRGMDLVVLPAIKFANHNTKIIVHSHATDDEEPYKRIKVKLDYIFKYIFSPLIDFGIGCSGDAMRWLFTKKKIDNKKAVVRYAGLSVEDFCFNDDSRSEIRKKYLIREDAFVMGHVGRICYQKNSLFLMDIFRHIVDLYENSRFIYIGDGEDKERVHRLAGEYAISDKIIFIDKTNDVSSFYSAMDVFVLPSVFEGLGLVLLEAQSNGLPCIASDTTSEEAKVLDSFYFESIQNTAETWAKKILCMYAKYKNEDRVKLNEVVKKSNFNLDVCCNQILEIYDMLMEDEKEKA